MNVILFSNLLVKLAGLGQVVQRIRMLLGSQASKVPEKMTTRRINIEVLSSSVSSLVENDVKVSIFQRNLAPRC